jgi:hypothetical protein
MRLRITKSIKSLQDSRMTFRGARRAPGPSITVGQLTPPWQAISTKMATWIWWFPIGRTAPCPSFWEMGTGPLLRMPRFR